MFNSQINVYIAMAMVFAFGVGASYLIISFANETNFEYLEIQTKLVD